MGVSKSCDWCEGRLEWTEINVEIKSVYSFSYEMTDIITELT